MPEFALLQFALLFKAREMRIAVSLCTFFRCARSCFFCNLPILKPVLSTVCAGHSLAGSKL
jgi:hypothetical protein